MPPVQRSKSSERREDRSGRHSAEYRRYLESVAWEKRRERSLMLAGHRCQDCGATENLEVHHLNYDWLGEEQDEDLRVLCHRCHQRADRQRRAMVATARNERRFQGWAAKVYGEGWGMYENEAELRARFHERYG